MLKKNNQLNKAQEYQVNLNRYRNRYGGIIEVSTFAVSVNSHTFPFFAEKRSDFNGTLRLFLVSRFTVIL